jgi:hypothetical protein
MFPNYLFDHDIFCLEFNCQPQEILNEVLSKDKISNYITNLSGCRELFIKNNIIIQIYEHLKIVIIITKDGIVTFGPNSVLYQKNNCFGKYQTVEKDYDFDKYFSMTIEEILDHCKLLLLYS